MRPKITSALPKAGGHSAKSNGLAHGFWRSAKDRQGLKPEINGILTARLKSCPCEEQNSELSALSASSAVRNSGVSPTLFPRQTAAGLVLLSSLQPAYAWR